MTLLQRFRKLVFLQVLVGILTFTLTTSSPALLVVAGMMASLAWYVVEGPRGRALPQWLIMPGALASFGWLMMDLFWDRADVVLSMGRFTVCLQVVMLFGQKRNREYGLILVLGLMQMISASVMTSSMLFGLLLALYCFCALLTVLMFHLKATSDHVVDSNRAAAPSWVRMPQLKLIHGQGDRGHFRGIALMIGLLCGIVGAIIFVTTPRHDVSLLRESLANMRFNRRVGFSPNISLTGAPFGAGSSETVLHLKITKNGKPVYGEDVSWLVRGSALDEYNPHTREWTRSRNLVEDWDFPMTVPLIGRTFSELRLEEPVLEVQVAQYMSESSILFSISPISSFGSTGIDEIKFNIVDQMLQAKNRQVGVLNYRERIPLRPKPRFFNRYYERVRDMKEGDLGASYQAETLRNRLPPLNDASGPQDYARGWEVKRDQILAFSIDVLSRAGIQIKNEKKPDSDLRIATALSDHLRTTFKYELTNDLFKPDFDPVGEFLLHAKRGHCEMFAAGLAAMARCVGLPARVISGFRASEYNHLAGLYTVRQNDAHAWTEIYCGDSGWVTFDATPAADVQQEHAVTRNWFTPFAEIYEYCELAWSNTVINYNSSRRQQLMLGFENTVQTMLDDDTTLVGASNAMAKDLMEKVRQFQDEWVINWPTYAMLAVVLVCILILVINVLVMLLTRLGLPRLLAWWRNRRSHHMPTGRHVRFYAAMLDLLHKHGHNRPDWQSPYKFASDLAQLDARRFGAVIPLTELFYEIRFGHREPDAPRREQIDLLMRTLRRSLQGG